MDSPTPRLLRLGDLLGELETDAADRWDAFNSGRPLGASTGLSRLDDAIGGHLRPGIHVLQGPAGIGKSALAQQIAATSCVPTMLISMELSPIELLLRHTARLTPAHLSKLKGSKPPMHPRELLALARAAAEKAPLLSIVDARTSWPTVAWIEEVAEGLRGEEKHMLLVLDSLHTWADGIPGGLGEYERLNEAIRGCIGLAARLGCPVLIVAEQSREGQKNGGGLSSSAGSRKFEYSAESVLDLGRAKDGGAPIPPTKGVEGRDIFELVCMIEKNRHGPKGAQIPLIWEPHYMRLSMEDDSHAAPQESWF